MIIEMMIEAVRETGIRPIDVFQKMSEGNSEIGRWLRGEDSGGYYETDLDFLDHYEAQIFRLIRQREREEELNRIPM